MIDLLIKHQSNQVAKPVNKKTGFNKPGICDSITNYFKGGFYNKDQVLEKLKTDFPEKDPQTTTIMAQLCKLRKIYEVETKTEDKVKFYKINPRPSETK